MHDPTMYVNDQTLQGKYENAAGDYKKIKITTQGQQHGDSNEQNKINLCSRSCEPSPAKLPRRVQLQFPQLNIYRVEFSLSCGTPKECPTTSRRSPSGPSYHSGPSPRK